MSETKDKEKKSLQMSEEKGKQLGKEKVVSYLQTQLDMKKEQLKYFETPLDENTIKDIRKVEELILKNKIRLSSMRRHIPESYDDKVRR